ncbi:MAG: 2-C-methyl-D-erythritol 4-phosphate cytidylyltransferase [Balneolaceae bacterium]
MGKRTFSLIIPAAGSGSRMGGGVPKPFRRIAERTILEHTLRQFASLEELVQVVVVTTSDYFEVVERLRPLFSSGVTLEWREGGLEREDSIRRGLEAVSEVAGLIVIHDAVRPFIRPEQVRQCLLKAERYGAAILAIPVTDTVKRVSNQGVVVSTPDRNELWKAQTPQVFQAELLRRAYRQPPAEGQRTTDDATLVENIGADVHIVEGSRDNFKITWPADFKLAELMLTK